VSDIFLPLQDGHQPRRLHAKRQDAVMAATMAMKAKKAEFGDSASEVLPKFAFDEAEQRPFPFLTARQKALELFGDDLVQDGLL
jgi:hypothetical protein